MSLALVENCRGDSPHASLARVHHANDALFSDYSISNTTIDFAGRETVRLSPFL